MAASPAGVTRVIAQAANSASLLVDNVSKTVSMKSPGLILYVVFLKNTNREDVKRAVEEIVSAKVFPLQFNIDMWKRQKEGNDDAPSGDDRPKPMALRDCKNANVMIIPQATLAGKLKAKSVQYHGQCDKGDASSLYYEFCQLMREALEVVGDCDANGVPTTGEVVSSRVVLNGTFGNRQGLDMSSAGPFTHCFDL